jgi:cytochrome c biogenesis protein CcmG/thiol:disulfide interchange protein DsbE
VLATLVFVLTPRPVAPGTVAVVIASSGGDRLDPVRVQLGTTAVAVGGEAPGAPDSRTAAHVTLPPGTYPVRVAGSASAAPVSLRSGATEVVLLAVREGRVVPGGVYVGVENVNLGLQELSGRLTPLFDFHLVDQDGRPLDRNALLGRDTVIAAFHTTCRETCPLYTGLLLQLRRSAPDVRLVEVTTDPATDSPGTLAAYRAAIGADWTFATGQADDLAEFWAPLGVTLSTGDTHTSALALVDRYGYIRAAYTGVPDVGGRLPAALEQQLSADGRRLLAGHGEGWGAPQVLDSLRTLAAAARTSIGGPAPTFSLGALDGRRVSLEQFRGRPLVVNFWWAGCPPCQRELPLLQRYADAHPGVSLLLVDPVDGVDGARSFVESLHLRATVLLDPGGQVTASYHVAAYPTTFFVGADGGIVSAYPGELSQAVLDAHLSNLGAG